ncbi:MAG: carbonic anhydrase [Gammaproteobacteria bacterium]|nr:carbonic anhydrase [Gammaproteobacteria bacterium]
MLNLPELFENNKRWAQKIKGIDPEFFAKLSGQQAPQYLWIGCADSRVPANEIVGMLPGELFVHRNVANLVYLDDPNCLSVIEYAVDVLKVKHIIVCGHYGCGGVAAALDGNTSGRIHKWLRSVREVLQQHRDTIDKLSTRLDQIDTLCELNVLRQLLNTARTDVVSNAWARGQELTLHGWIYNINDGILRDLGVCLSGEEEVDSTFVEA